MNLDNTEENILNPIINYYRIIRSSIIIDNNTIRNNNIRNIREIFINLTYYNKNCYEDLQFINSSYFITKSIFGNNYDYIVIKQVNNINELLEEIINIFDNNDYNEDIYPFQKIEIYNDSEHYIANINYLEFNNNILYTEITNP